MKSDQNRGRRLKAEGHLKAGPDTSRFMGLSADELIHELRVHQVELEMQSEELRRAQVELEKARDQYRGLYDTAPLAYYTLDHQGMIADANPAGAALLATSREKLLASGFSRFVAESSRSEFHAIRDRAAKADVQQTCQLVLVRPNGTDVAVHAAIARVADPAGGLPVRLLARNAQASGRTQTGPSLLRMALTDVTEIRRAEATLRKSEERYRRMVETANEGIWVLDAECRTTLANQRLADMLGYEVKDILGRSTEDFMFPEDVPTHVERIAGRRSGERGSYELRLRRKDGSECWTMVSASPVLNTQGRPEGSFAMLSDITDRKQAELALRDSEEIHRLLVENNMDGVLLTAPDGRIFAANQEACRIFGRTEAEICRLGRSGIVDPADPRLAQALAERERAGRFRAELTLVRADGTKFPAEVSSVGFTDRAGESRTSMVVRDLTERKRAEEALRESENKYRLVVDNAAEAILAVQDGKLVFTNPRAGEIAGFPPEELLGRPFIDFVHADDRALVADNYRKRLAGEHLPDRYDFRIVRGDGEIRAVEISAVRIDWQGRPATLNFLADISDRKLAEQALHESRAEYQTVFEGSPMGIYRTTPDGRILLANPALCRMLGYDSAADLCRRDLTLAGFGPGYDRTKFVETLAEKGRIDGLEAAWTRKDGTLAYIRENTRVVRGPDGSALYYDGTVEDISERKRAEQALQESEQRYRSLFEQNLAAVYRSTTDGRLLDCNEAFLDLLGFASRDQALACPTVEIYLSPQNRADFLSALRETGRLVNVETRLRHRDGSQIDVVENVHLVTAPDSGQEVIQGTMIDITGRKQAEEAVRVAAERWKLTFDGINDAVCILSPEGAILQCNAAMERLTGSSAAVLAGKNCSEAVHGTTGPPDNCPMVEVRKTLVRARSEVSLGDRTTEVTVDPLLDENGRLTGAVHVVTDITERKQAEERIRSDAQQWQATFDGISDAVCLLDAENRIQRCNAPLTRSVAKSPEELRGRVLCEIVHGSPTPIEGCPVRRARKSGHRETHEEQAGDRWLRVTADPVFGGDGSYVGAVHIVADVTERRQAEAEIEWLSRFPKENPSPVLRILADGTLAYANPSSKALLAALGCDVGSRVPADWQERVGKALSDRRPTETEQDLGGTTYSLLMNPVADQDYVNVYGRDVTERRRAEAAVTQWSADEASLLDASLTISRCRTDDEVCQAAADLAIKLNPDSRVLVTLSDPALSGVRVRAYRGFGSLTDSALATLGQDPRRMAIQATEMTDAEVTLYNSGRMVELPDGVYALLGRRAPRAACAAVERRLDIDRVYCVGFGLEGAHSGGIVLLARKGAAVRGREMIETLVNHVAVAVRRLRAEHSLREEKERAREYLDIAGVMLVALDRNGRVTLVNRHGSGVLGYGEDELDGKSWIDTCVPERVRNETKGVFSWLMAGAASPVEYYENLVVTRSGEERLIAWHNVVLRDQSGRPVGTLSSGEDVTERKQTEQALKESEERFRRFSQTAPDAIVMADDEGHVDFWNEAAERMFGYTHEAALGRSLPELVAPPALRERFRAGLASFARTGSGPLLGRLMQYNAMRQDGSEFPVELMMSSMQLQGRWHSIGTIRDVTERKRAEERDRQHMKDTTLLRDTAIGFIQLAPDADVYQYVADRLSALVGEAYVIINSYDEATDEYTVRALAGIGARLETVLKVMGRNPVGTVFTIARENRAEYASERLLEFKDGLRGLSYGKLPKVLTRTIEKTFDIGGVYAMGFHWQGRTLGTLNLIMRRGADVRDPAAVEAFVNQTAIAIQHRLDADELSRYRERLEETIAARTRDLIATQEQLILQEKLATVGRVAGSVAHELRNPLGAIRNASYYLQMTAAPRLEGKQLRHLQVIDEYVDRANQAISMILDFTQGRQSEPVLCALQPILQRAVTDASLPPNVEVLIAIPPRLPEVLVDDGQIVVVFRNLLTNAGRAMPGGGTVKIEARAGQDEVVVDVTDTGTGIKPEHMARLFQPLFTTGEIGIGLGLAICQGFVRANKGTIAVVSELGKGATFTVTLPTAEGQTLNRRPPRDAKL